MEAHGIFHRVFVEGTIIGSSASFHDNRQSKLLCIFHGSESTSTDFHGSFHGSKFPSVEVNVLP